MKKQISQKAIRLWRIQLTVFSLPLFFIIGMVIAFSIPLGIIILSVLVLLYFIFFFYYLPKRYDTTHYQIEHATFTLTIGVFLKKNLNTECNKIIYIRTSQTILQRIFNLCTLRFHPIGKVIVLTQIDLEQADTLRKQIEEISNER